MQEKAQILVVDDEPQMLLAMETVLVRLGHHVSQCATAHDALKLLENSKFDLVISDIKMPEMSGVELLQVLHQSFPQLPVVMITAYGTIIQAVEAMKNGAFDFITKPFAAEDLERIVEKVFQPVKKTSSPRQSAISPSTVAIVTNDPIFKRLLELATAVAPSTASVLIQGESGTGKELIARLIHSSSRRYLGPFVAVNCAALPGNLLESELFGHEKGSFTGATATKIGRFELANGGTILLDEISEMEPVLQAKLLRVIQEREVDRIGGQKPIAIDVRIVATTNRNIAQSVTRGEFREDLYYRLNVIPLSISPLRERKGDVKLLIEHFMRKFALREMRSLTPELIAELTNHTWPGNVRELQNACERAVLLAGNEILSYQHFMVGGLSKIRSEQALHGEGDDLRLHPGLSVAEAEKLLIFETLRSTGNNKTRAAELLGISIRTLRNKLHEYGVGENSLEA